MTKASERILRRARKMIAATGWTQGTYEDATGDKHLHCLVGWINVCSNIAADYSSPERCRWDESPLPKPRNDALDALIRHLPKTFQKRPDCVEQWNDHPKRTRDDVLALIDKALAK